MTSDELENLFLLVTRHSSLNKEMPFITATREDGATLLVNLDRIQYVAYRDMAGHESIQIVFDTNPPAGGPNGTNEITLHGEEARRVWEALSSVLSI